MDSTRKTALVTGVFFVITIIASIPALGFYGPVLNDPDYILGAGPEDVVGIVQHRGVEEERWDRGDDGDDEEHARNERGLSGRGHLESFPLM